MAKLKTGRHTSALKQQRKSLRLKDHNIEIRSKIRTFVKKVEDAVSKKDAALAQQLLKNASSAWDKAAKRNVIHKNAASNQIARLSKLVGSLTASK